MRRWDVGMDIVGYGEGTRDTVLLYDQPICVFILLRGASSLYKFAAHIAERLGPRSEALCDRLLGRPNDLVADWAWKRTRYRHLKARCGCKPKDLCALLDCCFGRSEHLLGAEGELLIYDEVARHQRLARKCVSCPGCGSTNLCACGNLRGQSGGVVQ